MKAVKMFMLVACLLASVTVTHAQSIDKSIKDWERAKAYTKEYLDAMPESGYALISCCISPTPTMALRLQPPARRAR